jgi:hypothetical protein
MIPDRDLDCEPDDDISQVPGPLEPLIAQPSLRWPWPYTNDEITAIADVLPQPLKQGVLEYIIRVTRLYVKCTLEWAKTEKPNVRNEVSRLSEAINELISAIRDISPLSQEHLTKRSRGLHPEVTLQTIQRALDRFEQDHRFAFQLLPPGSKGGRREKPHERKLYERIEEAWKSAHGSKPPPTGFPKFEKLCLAPLQLRWGLPTITDGSDWRSQRHRRRKNSEKSG